MIFVLPLFVCFLFVSLFFSFSGYFWVHTSRPLQQKDVTSTKVREKQVNKRKTGNEYEKFSVLNKYMIVKPCGTFPKFATHFQLVPYKF